MNRRIPQRPLPVNPLGRDEEDLRSDACVPPPPALLHGLDLFNRGFYWEAHEAWEALWHAAGRRGPVADAYKGLIALAAAGVKARAGNAAGVRHHAERAARLFEKLAGESGRIAAPIPGLSLPDLLRHATALASRPVVDETRSGEARAVLPFVLTWGPPADDASA